MQGNRDKVRTDKNAYTWTGLGLLVAGTIVVLTSMLILSSLVWLTALGIAMLIMAFILLALARTIPRVTPEVGMLLLETGIDNIATVVEELGIKSKPVYLPSSLTGGRPQALIPLHINPSLPKITSALPRRFIVRYGNGPDDVGLLVTTAGTVATGMLESTPGPSATQLESTLASLFVGKLGAADRIRVYVIEPGLRVEIRAPRIQNAGTWTHQCLDSSLASVVASVAAEAWNKPFVVAKEEQHGRTYTVEIEAVE
ncbi:MAG: hypothetical protein JSV77_07460 [Dehalococcoidales bacterium]|nr:MAG: hypothetical protein JSV77_07460 [Dehalococcoidales bacterium]